MMARLFAMLALLALSLASLAAAQQRAASLRFHNSMSPNAASAALPTAQIKIGLGFISVFECGAKGDGTDQTTAIQNCAEKLSAGGGTLFFPKGNYVISDSTAVPSDTRILGEGFGSLITAAADATWPGVTITSAFNNLNGNNIIVERMHFAYPMLAGQANHILNFSGTSHVEIVDNVSSGGGDFAAFIGASDIYETGNVVTNVTNSCYDHWGGSTDVRVIGNYCSTYAGAGSGVGAIQFTGINTNGSAANNAGLVAVGNEIYINNGNAPQGIIINGHERRGHDDNVIIADNKIVVQNGHSAWGILVSGHANNISIHDNYCEGGTTREGDYSCVGAFSPATGVDIHNNTADNWQAPAQGVFVNTAVGGSIHDNAAH